MSGLDPVKLRIQAEQQIQDDSRGLDVGTILRSWQVQC